MLSPPQSTGTPPQTPALGCTTPGAHGTDPRDTQSPHEEMGEKEGWRSQGFPGARSPLGMGRTGPSPPPRHPRLSPSLMVTRRN